MAYVQQAELTLDEKRVRCTTAGPSDTHFANMSTDVGVVKAFQNAMLLLEDP